MSSRRYIEAAGTSGLKVREILEFEEDASGREKSRSVVLTIPRTVPYETVVDVLDALRRAYRVGREDLAFEAAEARPL